VVAVDAESFEGCFREHFAGLVAFGEASSGDRDVARELAQETFARLHQHWSSVGEIATALGVSPNTVKSALSKARALLRTRWETTDV
jgi:DNA-directed RNA polymerase specialized sigma24 family protein